MMLLCSGPSKALLKSPSALHGNLHRRMEPWGKCQARSDEHSLELQIVLEMCTSGGRSTLHRPIFLWGMVVGERGESAVVCPPQWRCPGFVLFPKI